MPEAVVSTESVVDNAATSALDQIDALMAEAHTRADATTESASTETPQTETVDSTTPGAHAAEEPHDNPAETEEADAQETGEEADQEAPKQDTPTQTQTQKTPSRREAARLQEQLLAAEETNRQLRQQLEQRSVVDNQVRSRYADRLGTPQEKADLEAVLANPRASVQHVDQARTRLMQMRAAGEELAPLHQAIEQDVFQSFVRGLNSLRSLEGMDEASHQALFKAKDGVSALRQMYDIGRKAAAAEAEGELKGLKASLSELRTKQAARSTQPAAGSGSSSPSSALSGLIGADGLPTDEAIERARSGGLRSLGAS